MKRLASMSTGLLFAALLASSPAQAATDDAIVKLSLTGEGSGNTYNGTAGGGATKVTNYSYLSSNGANIGVSLLDGPQYAIDDGKGGELVYMVRGNGAYVAGDGTMFPLVAGNFILLGPGLATGRDFRGYAHFYITFGVAADDYKGAPQMRRLDPAGLPDAAFTKSGNGEEHVFFASGTGTKASVMRWKGRASGAAKAGSATFMTVVSGTGSIAQGARKFTLASGDTFSVPAGASYDWSGQDLRLMIVTVGSSGK